MAAIGTNYPTFGQLPPQGDRLETSELVKRVALKALLTSTYIFMASAVAGALFPPAMPYALLAGGILAIAAITYHIYRGIEMQPIHGNQIEELKEKDWWRVKCKVIEKATHSLQISGNISVEELYHIEEQLKAQENLHVYLLCEQKDGLSRIINEYPDRVHTVITPKGKNTVQMCVANGVYAEYGRSIMAGALGTRLSNDFYHLFAKWDAIVNKKSHAEVPPGIPQLGVPSALSGDSFDYSINPVTHSPGQRQNLVSKAYRDFIEKIDVDVEEDVELMIRRDIDETLKQLLIKAMERGIYVNIFAHDIEQKEILELQAKAKELGNEYLVSVYETQDHMRYIECNRSMLFGNSPLSDDVDSMVILQTPQTPRARETSEAD
ncbi:MAG: hypothetical protein P0S94_01365 [Simkaniaceae bacterium]|nr:hypothetical protein [Simkaniaceae bacterium]